MSKAVARYYPRAKSTWQQIPINYKIIGGAVIAAGLYFYFKKPAAGTNDAANADATSVQTNTANFNQQLPFYANLADSIYDYMNSEWLTDGGLDSSVITPLSNLNADEVKQVYKDFGARTFDWTVKPFDRSAHNLRSFAQQSMDSSGYNSLDAILTAAGI